MCGLSIWCICTHGHIPCTGTGTIAYEWNGKWEAVRDSPPTKRTYCSCLASQSEIKCDIADVSAIRIQCRWDFCAQHRSLHTRRPCVCSYLYCMRSGQQPIAIKKKQIRIHLDAHFINFLSFFVISKVCVQVLFAMHSHFNVHTFFFAFCLFMRRDDLLLFSSFERVSLTSN